MPTRKGCGRRVRIGQGLVRTPGMTHQPAPPPTVARTKPNRETSDRFTAALTAEVGAEAFANWFNHLTRIDADDRGVTVSVATPYLMGYLRKTYSQTLRQIAVGICGAGAVCDWAIDESLAVESPNRAAIVPQPVDEKPATVRGETFDRFVVGESNRTAWSIARSFCSEPRRRDNVVYLYGPTGCGKTHLAEAVRNELRATQPGLRTLSLSAWDFGNELSDAIATRTTPSFRSRFRGIGALILDNACFFDGARKESFQDGLLQTIDRLQSDGCAVLLTGSVHPKMLTQTSSELVSRYLAGHVGRLGEPDEAVRQAIVRQHADSVGLKMTADASAYVAGKFRRSVREIQGAVNTLCNEVRAEEDLARLAGGEADGQLFDIVRKPTRTVGITLARRLLGSLQQDSAVVVRLPDIDRQVCELFGIDRIGLHGPGRSRALSRPRMVAMYLARKLTAAAYKEIGSHFGGRNHSTVMSAEKTVRKMLNESAVIKAGSVDWSTADLLAELERRLIA